MFRIHFRKTFLAMLLGIETPAAVRIMTTRNEHGAIVYTPQAKWLGTWVDNAYSTTKVKTLMWDLYGPRASKGRNLEDIEVVGVSTSKTLMEYQKLKLDYFPFDPPRKS